MRFYGGRIDCNGLDYCESYRKTRVWTQHVENPTEWGPFLAPRTTFPKKNMPLINCSPNSAQVYNGIGLPAF